MPVLILRSHRRYGYGGVVPFRIVLALLLFLVGTNAQRFFFGVPRINHCAAAYDGALHIFGGDDPSTGGAGSLLPASPDHLSLFFGNPPSIQAPGVTRPGVEFGNFTELAHGGCAVASHGQAIIVPPNAPVFMFNLTSLDATLIPPSVLRTSNRTLFAAPDNPTALPQQDMAMAMWKDQLVIFGGSVMFPNGTRSPVRDTFILDCTSPPRWRWGWVGSNRLTPPASLTKGVMVATNNMVLHFSPINATAMAIYHFDPLNRAWLSPISIFEPDTPSVIPVPVLYANGTPTDDVIIFPATQGTPSQRPPPQHRLWKYEWIAIAQAGRFTSIPLDSAFDPVDGTATAVNDLVVIYGGNRTAQNSLRFFNTSSESSSSSIVVPDWSNASFQPTTHTPWPTPTFPGLSLSEDDTHRIGVIVGSVFGVLGFLLIVALVWCLYRRRRRHQERSRAIRYHSTAATPPVTSVRHMDGPSKEASMIDASLINNDSHSWSQELQQGMSAVSGRENLDGEKPASVSSHTDHQQHIQTPSVKSVQEQSRFVERFDTYFPEHLRDPEGNPSLGDESVSELESLNSSRH